MSDWGATRSLEAARAALDLVMPGPSGPWGDELVAAVRDGCVASPPSTTRSCACFGSPRASAPSTASTAPGRAAARRRRRLVGPPDAPARRPQRLRRVPTTSPATRRGPGRTRRSPRTLRATAAASFVLARNHGSLLPLTARTLRRVAVIGPNAAVARTLGGGSATVFPPYTVSPLEGLRAALPQRGGRRTRPASAPTRGCPSRTSAAELRFLDADGSAARAPSSARSASSPGSARSTRRSRRSRSTRRSRPSATGEHIVGCSGAGRYRLTLDGERGVRRARSRCARTPTPARTSSRRRSMASRSRSPPARSSRSS